MVPLPAYYSQGDFTHANPIPSIAKRTSSPCNDLGNCRTIWDIIWSCLVTISVSAWVAVHPNIPRPINNRGGSFLDRWLWIPLRTFISHRLPLFACALLVPEYILGWAIRQHIVARQIAEENGGWTTTHGFFVIMGGFHLFQHSDSERAGYILNPYEDDIPYHPLSIQDLRGDAFEFNVPTEEEINDRSKSDWLAKGLVLVQTAWFILQCIARGIEHIPVTELEIIALAYAMMNFGIYIFWWNKPLNVGNPVRVFRRPTTSPDDGGPGIGVSHNRSRVAHRPLMRFLNWLGQAGKFVAGIQDGDVNLSNEHKVPTFWSGNPSSGQIFKADLITLAVGLIFGGIHCVAWSFAFASHVELLLWHISCVALVAVPAFVLAYGWCWRIVKQLTPLILILAVVLTLAILLYITARVVTVLLAFASLRSLPPAAYATVQWTTFIPHI